VPASMLKFAGPCKLTGTLGREKLVPLALGATPQQAGPNGVEDQGGRLRGARYVGPPRAPFKS